MRILMYPGKHKTYLRQNEYIQKQKKEEQLMKQGENIISKNKCSKLYFNIKALQQT